MISLTVKFDESVLPEEEGEFLLYMEKLLRFHYPKDVRVFKEKMGDDSKIRQKMTPDERSRL